MLRFTIAMRVVTAIALMLSTLLPASRADAQDREPAMVEETPAARTAATTTTRMSIRESLAAIGYGTGTASDASNRQPPAAFQITTGQRQRSTARKVFGGLLGAAAGFLGGGYLGARIDGECGGCDDPGLKGAVIGAPIGAIVGAIVGAKWF